MHLRVFDPLDLSAVRNGRLKGSMAQRFAVFVLLVLGAAGGLHMALADPQRAAGLRRTVFLGDSLLDLVAPLAEPPGFHTLGGLEVVVRFPHEERIAIHTIRCLLNGADVTDQLTVGRNGAGGQVYPLLEGNNQLDCQVFGRGWWARRYFLDGVHAAVRVRAPLSFDAG